MLKGLSLGNSSKKLRQVIPVSGSSVGWINTSEENQNVQNEPIVKKESKFDVNILDYMSIDEFIELMRIKTDNNYDVLWHASKTLAMQVKASKALLSLSSQLCAGKSKADVLDKLVDAMKFSLKADHVYILEFSGFDNSLRVTHADSISASNFIVPRDSGIEGNVFMNGSIVNQCVYSPDTPDVTVPSALDKMIHFQSYYVLCAPIIVDNQTYGVIRACRGKRMEGSSKLSPRGEVSDAPVVPFGDQEESMIGYTASNVGFVLKYVSNQSLDNRQGRVDNFVSPRSIGSGTIANVVDWIIHCIYKDFHADRVSIFKVNKDRNTLDCIISQDILGLCMPMQSGIMGDVLKTLKVVNIPNVQSNPLFYNEFDRITNYVTKNVLCAPILSSSGEGIGVLQLLNKNGGNNQWNTQDEAQIIEIAVRLSILLNAQLELQSVHTEKRIAGALSSAMHQMIATQSYSEMVAIAKFNLSALLEVDFVELYEITNVDGSITMAKVNANPAPQRIVEDNYSKSSIPATVSGAVNGVSDIILTPPKAVLDCIRTGEVQVYNSNSLSNKSGSEFVPGLSPKYATVFPVSSKVFAGNPSKHVMIVARTKINQPFSTTEKASVTLFVEMLGNVMNTFHKVKEHDLALVQRNWELNMIVNAMKLMHNYVLLLDDAGVVIACNKQMDEVFKEVKLFSHISKWLGVDSVMGDDVTTVYSTRCSVHKDCVVIHAGEDMEGNLVSYQLCPVDSNGTVHNEGNAPLKDIKSLIIVLHKHTDDENGIKRLRQVLAAKAMNLTNNVGQGDTSTIHGTMNVVAQAICELGGRFNLGYAEQRAINHVAANVMQVGRNLRASVAYSASLANNAFVDHPTIAPDSLVLVCEEAKAIPNLFTWDFDVNLYKDKSTLRGILGRLFESMFNLSEIQVNPKTLACFFREAEKHYHDNPFHNFYHITCVTHFSYMLIQATKGIELLNNNMYYIFSIMLSAVVHDIDHPGNSNLYEINSKSELALLYNDQSVLENHHCSMAFRIMKFNNSDVLAELPPAAFKDVKKTVVSCILATDMSVHFELIDKVKKKVSDGWNLSDMGDVLFFCRIVLHAADLSNPVRIFPLAKLWAGRISEEFNRQVENEKKQGLPVLGFMITPDEKTLCKNEIGFASFVVAPLWRNLELLFPSLKPLVTQLNINLDKYKEVLEQINDAEDRKPVTPKE